MEDQVKIKRILSRVDDSVFDDGDWNFIIMECSSLAAHWDKLGGYLGLDGSTIALIKANHPLDNAGCWNEALSQWIRQNYKTERHGMPSWRMLVGAIARVNKLMFKKLAIAHAKPGQAPHIKEEFETAGPDQTATAEYKTIVECTPSLILSLKSHLTDLSAQLVQRYLIDSKQDSDLRNEMHSEASRATRLMELIRDKVEQNPKCYTMFIEALEQDWTANQDILEKLKETYDSFSGESQKVNKTASHSQMQEEAALAAGQATSSTGQCEHQQTTASQLLSIDNLADVLEAVWEAREKWYYIGLKLGVTSDRLEDVKLNNQNLDDRFTAVIKDWLNRGEATRTWGTLAKALRSPMVGYGHLVNILPQHAD